jgi:hypothetical protein
LPADITTTPAAPSFRPEALPAVTLRRLAVDELVGVEHDRVALLLRDAHAHDLVLEEAGVLRRGGLGLRGVGQRVLLLARDAVLPGHVLGGDAHVVLVVDVPQPVLDHRVDQLPVAHALAVARVGQHVR